MRCREQNHVPIGWPARASSAQTAAAALDLVRAASTHVDAIRRIVEPARQPQLLAVGADVASAAALGVGAVLGGEAVCAVTDHADAPEASGKSDARRVCARRMQALSLGDSRAANDSDPAAATQCWRRRGGKRSRAASIADECALPALSYLACCSKVRGAGGSAAGTPRHGRRRCSLPARRPRMDLVAAPLAGAAASLKRP